MALTSTLYRFRIDLSDVDRSVYESLDLRVARHPSESEEFLATKILAYALAYQNGIEFWPGGLSDPDEPCIFIKSPQGGYELWIEIGNPSARKVHRAAKAAKNTKIFTYKDPRPLLEDLSANTIHRKSELEIFSFSKGFLGKIIPTLERDNRWSLLVNDGVLTWTCAGSTLEGEILCHDLK